RWGLGGLVSAREVDVGSRVFVLMDGVAGEVQELWLELGSVNRAMALEGGAGVLAAVSNSTLVPGGEKLRGMLRSWAPAQQAMLAAIAARAGVAQAGRRFSAVVLGGKRAGFPRAGATDLCTTITYVLNSLMAHPGLH